jgi:hypothetical protein
VAKATVFELRPPVAFTNWRDASLHLRINILQFVYENPQPPYNQYSLTTHRDLSQFLWHVQYGGQRVIPLSQIKAHCNTFYVAKRAVANLSNNEVCPENALEYRYCDRAELKWCTTLKTSDTLPHKFAHILPKRSATLARFLYKPPSEPDGLPSNKTIVSVFSLCISPISVPQDSVKLALAT